MCRALAYLGSPVLLDDLLFKSDSSLMKQTYAPQMLKALNLAGLGMAAWVREVIFPCDQEQSLGQCKTKDRLFSTDKFQSRLIENNRISR